MKTSVKIDANLLEEAAKLTGITDNAAIIRLALESLIARESARQLVSLVGSQPNLTPPRRRRDDNSI